MKGAKFVRRVYPNAIAHSWADCWMIYPNPHSNNTDLGNGRTRTAAWADAEKNIRAASRHKTSNERQEKNEDFQKP